MMEKRLTIGSSVFDLEHLVAALVQYNLLPKLVEAVVLDRAIEHIPLTKQAVYERLTGLRDGVIPDDFETFLQVWCEENRQSFRDLNAKVLRPLRIQRFKALRFHQQVPAEFLRLKDDLDQVEYSLIQVASLELAQDLFFQLRDDGVDFAQLAAAVSLGPERQSAGWVGPVPVSSLPPQVRRWLKSATPGTICSPIQVNHGFWLVRLEQLSTARLTEAVRQRIVERLFSQWLQDESRRWMETPGQVYYGPISSAPALPGGAS